MSTALTLTRTQLAQRSSATADVTLIWQKREGIDTALVCVSDRETCTYFEIPAEPYLALDIYHHPFAYRDFSTVVHRLRTASTRSARAASTT